MTRHLSAAAEPLELHRQPGDLRLHPAGPRPVGVLHLLALLLVLVDVEVDVVVEQRLLREYVGVDGELVVLDDLAGRRAVLDRAVQTGQVGEGRLGNVGFGGVHQENRLEDVAEVAGEVGLELVGDARYADEEAVDQVFARSRNRRNDECRKSMD